MGHRPLAAQAQPCFPRPQPLSLAVGALPVALPHLAIEGPGWTPVFPHEDTKPSCPQTTPFRSLSRGLGTLWSGAVGPHLAIGSLEFILREVFNARLPFLPSKIWFSPLVIEEAIFKK